MVSYYHVIPLLQKECKLLSNVPVLFDSKVSIKAIKSEHIGAIMKRRSDFSASLSGKTKCILIEPGAVSASIDEVQRIALHASFVLNFFAKSGASMCVQSFKLKYDRSHVMIGVDAISSIGPPNHGKYEIDNTVSPNEIKTLYQSTQKAVLKDKSLIISIKRFNGALTKTELDDKLIDITICLESIFNAQNEISFRFSLYNSIISEADPQRRYESFLLLKKLYNLRSNIVHGNKDIDSVWTSENWPKIISIAKIALVKKIEFLQANESLAWQAHLDKIALGAV